MSTVIALRNISLQMGQSLLLQQINLDLAEGETGVIVGDTGSGKSTLLRLILGLPGMQQDDQMQLEGEVEVAGRQIFDLDQRQLQELRWQVGVVKWGGGLIENMDVRRNICLPLAYRASHFSGDDIDRRCVEIMNRLDIAHLAGLGRRPVTLNAEERAYVSLARALINEPILLLVDDATLGMGEETAQRFIEHLFAGRGLPRLMVTTRVLPYVNRGDRFYLLEKGTVIPLGDRQELLGCDHPWIRAEMANSSRG